MNTQTKAISIEDYLALFNAAKARAENAQTNRELTDAKYAMQSAMGEVKHMLDVEYVGIKTKKKESAASISTELR